MHTYITLLIVECASWILQLHFAHTSGETSTSGIPATRFLLLKTGDAEGGDSSSDTLNLVHEAIARVGTAMTRNLFALVGFVREFVFVVGKCKFATIHDMCKVQQVRWGHG